MPSNFQELFGDRAFPNMLERQLGTAATLYQPRDAGLQTTSLSVVFNEIAGFVDDLRRGVFQLDSDSMPSAYPNVKKGDYFVLNSTDDPDQLEWNVDEVRDDKSGTIEVRVVGMMERL